MSEVKPLTDDDLKSLANYVAEQEEGLHGLPLVLGNGTPINRLLATIETYKDEVEGARNAGLEEAAALIVGWREIEPKGDEYERWDLGCRLVADELADRIRALKTTPTGGE
jgi:hypothetical protein